MGAVRTGTVRRGSRGNESGAGKRRQRGVRHRWADLSCLPQLPYEIRRGLSVGRMDLARLAQWLAGTEGSIALHESLYMYPLVESVHVIGIMLFVGTIAMVDLR